MTRIDFYRYAEDKLRVACRLAAKALTQSRRVVVYSPDAKVLADFDRTLWTYQATGFVPHCFSESPLAPETPGLGIDWDFAAIDRLAVARASVH